jgi:cytoskeletal protein RodZ
MEEIKMGPVHWVLLILFVGVLGFLGIKSGFPTTPQMPAVKNPEAVRPAPKNLTPVESSAEVAPANEAPVAPSVDTPEATPTE